MIPHAARGLRAATTIDRTKPELTAAPQDGEDAVRDPLLRFRIGYQDAHSKPFPATFTCLRTAADAADASGTDSGQLAYDAGCSVPAQPNAKQTHFDCARSVPAGTPDGPVTFCAAGADPRCRTGRAAPTRAGARARRRDRVEVGRRRRRLRCDR